MESALPSMPSFKIDRPTLWPAFLKTHLRGGSPLDTTLSIKVPGTVVPYVIYLASKNCIILRAGLSILKIRWYKFKLCLSHVACSCHRLCSPSAVPDHESSQFSGFNQMRLSTCIRLDRKCSWRNKTA